jgi:hypothetical protein
MSRVIAVAAVVALLVACTSAGPATPVTGHYAVYFEPSFAAPISYGRLTIPAADVEEAIRTVFVERFDSITFFDDPPKDIASYDAVINIRIDRSPGRGGWPPPVPGSGDMSTLPALVEDTILAFDVLAGGKKPHGGFVTVQRPVDPTGYGFDPRMLNVTATDLATAVTSELRRAVPEAVETR